MDFGRLVRRSLTFYWRTNIAVVLGVATAVSVLSGALLVGHSVRGSLADLMRQRLGSADLVIASPVFFRERLAADIAAHPRFGAAFKASAPLIMADAVVTEQDSGRRAGHVTVYGIDDRFWRFHAVAPVALGDREAALSPALAREIGARQDAAILVRVQRPSDIPLESLQSRKEDLGRTLRLTTRAILAPSSLGEFSLKAEQGDVMAVFVPLDRLRAELEVGERVNAVLVSRSAAAGGGEALDAILADVIAPADVGLTVRASDDGRVVIVESSASLMDDRQAAAIQQVRVGSGMSVFTYLANAMRVDGKEVPYSLVTGIDLQSVMPTLSSDRASAANGVPPILLNAWAEKDLTAKSGDRLTMDFFVWEDPGRLVTRSAEFQVAGIVPIEAGSRDLAPPYPGISDTKSLSDWDPPFPLDLRRVRPIDEEYWDRYRTTPKAFVPMAVAQRLWGTRYGSLTSVRIAPPAGQTAAALVPQVSAALKSAVKPGSFGVSARDVRAAGALASRGATDFGEYFIYFSFFLVVSALVLVVLFFKLGVEQRVREVGLLRAVGMPPWTIRRLFAAEGATLAVGGSLLGVVGALSYARLLIWALTTRWFNAVGTSALTLHVSMTSLALGAVGGVIVAVACIWWTLGSLQRISERTLLAGELTLSSDGRPPSTLATWIAWLLAATGAVLVMLAATGRIAAAFGYFGAGASLLLAALLALSIALRRRRHRQISGHGWRPLSLLAARNAAHRPSRTVLSMSVIACATFILVTVDAFRRGSDVDASAPTSGTGGYELLVNTLVPVVHDPNSDAGRDALNLVALDRSTSIEPFRLRPGDDASCLNLYQPQNPRIAAPRDAFLAEGRFAFQASAANTDAERANPWLLLNRVEPDGAVPVIADANSMTYVLHRAVGDEFVITNSGAPVTLRFVAALRDSIFQSELLISESNFKRIFPDQQGFQLLLVDVSGDAAEAARQIEQGLSDLGADAIQTADHLASFHRVENTYLSTFQTLGGLGLLLGTVGLATVFLRNIMERRRELALLAAVGFRRSHFLLMTALENVLIVVGGLTVGAAAAAIAIAPAVHERGGRFPFSSGVVLLLFAVFVVAMLSSLAALAAASKTPLLEGLRSE